jgi:hypothetical protein
MPAQPRIRSNQLEEISGAGERRENDDVEFQYGGV